ncbi:sugar transferase [Fluviispira vulneris]|uniref:sugar transferase n=1 Tax=Fluviispira vulneris TaxID=2763012 RepID=UPI0016484C38|nr:sugar transferase [Fluviispira vulneris]
MIHVKHIRRRKFFVLVDFLVVLLSIYIAIFVRTKINIPIFEGLLPSAVIDQQITLFFTTIILGSSFCISGYLVGLYDMWNTSSITIWAQKIIFPNLLIVAIAFSYLYLSKNFYFPSSFLVTLFIINFWLSLLWRVFYFKIFEREISNIVLIGEHENCYEFSQEFLKDPFINRIKVCAIFCYNIKESIASTGLQPKNISEFKNFSQDNLITSIIIVNSNNIQENIFPDVFKAARKGVQVFTVPNHYEILLGRLRHVHVNDLPLIELKLENSVSFYLKIKRLFDILFSLIILTFLSIPIAIISILTKLTSKGPVIYKQQRVGRDSKVFNIIKFRSMMDNAELKTGDVFASKNDPRITKFGKFMRETRLDEIPQLINILKGDMSFIGPRPERPSFVNKFEKEIPAYSERTRIRPGLTGLAQIHGDYESSADTKLKYDLAYLVNQSFFLDFQILVKTIKVLLLRKGQ